MRVKIMFSLIVLLAISATQTQSNEDGSKTKERIGHYRAKPGYSSGLGSSLRKSQRDESGADSGESGERGETNNLRAQNQESNNHNHNHNHNHPSTRNNGAGGREGDHGPSFPHQFSYGYSITDHDYDQKVQFQSRNPHQTPQHYFNHHNHQSPYDHQRGFLHYENNYDAQRPETPRRAPPPPPPPPNSERHPQRNRGLTPGRIGNIFDTQTHHAAATRTVIPIARFASPLPYHIGYSQPAAVTPFGFLPQVAAAPPFTYLAGPTPVIAPQPLSAVVASASQGAQIAIPVTVPVVDHINVAQESEDPLPVPTQPIGE